MDPLLGINSNTPLISIGANGAVTPTFGLLASDVGLPTSVLFGGASTVASLSSVGQLLSAAATFQDQVQALQPGTATSGGGQNFGTDFASLAAEAQNFVDIFNNLQNNIANINATSNLFGGNATSASGLVQSLNTQVQANFSNGNSTLTNLAQLGIEFQPSRLPGGGGSLSINLNTLQSAFNTNAAGAFSLLSTAANALGGAANNFVSQAGNQYSSLALLAQSTGGAGSLSNIITSGLLSQSNGNSNLSNLFGSGANLQQVILALNEYSLVSGLLA